MARTTAHLSRVLLGALLSATFAFAGCDDDDDGAVVDGGVSVELPDAGGDASDANRSPDLANAPAGAAKQVVVDVDHTELTRPALGALLGVTLAPVAGTPSVSSAPLATGPFSEIELRESQSLSLALLTVRAGQVLPVADFVGDLIPAGMAPSIDPNVQPEGTENYVMKNEKREMMLQFGAKSRTLRAAVLIQRRW